MTTPLQDAIAQAQASLVTAAALAVPVVVTPPPPPPPPPAGPVSISPVTTSVVNGDLVLAAGQSATGALVHGRIIAKGAGCSANDCVATGAPGEAISLGIADATAAGADLTLTNVLLYDASPTAASIGIYGHKVTIRGVEIHGTTDGLRVNNPHAPDAIWDIDGLYVRDHFWGVDKSQANGFVHGDGCQVQNCTSLKMRNAWLTGLNDPKFGGPVQANSALMLGQDLGPITGLDIQGNHLGGGLVACVNLAAKGLPFRAGVISDNVFIRANLSRIAIIMAASTVCATDRNVYDDGTPIVVNRNGA